MNAAQRAGGLAVVSPHLDDAVFGCGEAMSRANATTVVTVFAGVPPGDHALTPWDSACGSVTARTQVSSAAPLSDESLRTRLGADEISAELAAERGAGKQRALRCYASQLRAFSAVALADTAQPERRWDLGDG